MNQQQSNYYMDKKLKEAAAELLDKRLIAKLNEGDLVATEIKYRKTCLSEFYNKVRTFASKASTAEQENRLFRASLSQTLNVI